MQHDEVLPEEKVFGNECPGTTGSEEGHEAVDQSSCEQIQVLHGRVDYTSPFGTPDGPIMTPVRGRLVFRHAQAALVRQSLGHDPLSGSLYVFGNKRRERIKILFWEPGGYCLCTRRLEQGTFRWPQREAACARYLLIYDKEFAWYLGWVGCHSANDSNMHEAKPNAGSWRVVIGRGE